uniref:Transmembrane protein n=1 Tax=Globodera rostochiensis TaxID=31243 RepID=A0A914GW06_GLORO
MPPSFVFRPVWCRIPMPPCPRGGLADCDVMRAQASRAVPPYKYAHRWMAVAHFINLVRNPTVPFLSVLLIVALGGAIPIYNVLLMPPNNGMSAFMPEAFATLHRQRTGQNEFFRTAAKKSSSLSSSASSSAFPSQQSFAFQSQEALKNNRVARDITDDGTNEVGAAADAAKFAFAFAKRSAAQWDDGGRHGGLGQLPFAVEIIERMSPNTFLNLNYLGAEPSVFDQFRSIRSPRPQGI